MTATAKTMNWTRLNDSIFSTDNRYANCTLQYAPLIQSFADETECYEIMEYFSSFIVIFFLLFSPFLSRIYFLQMNSVLDNNESPLYIFIILHVKRLSCKKEATVLLSTWHYSCLFVFPLRLTTNIIVLIIYLLLNNCYTINSYIEKDN